MTSFLFVDLCDHLHLVMVENDNPTVLFSSKKKTNWWKESEDNYKNYFLGNCFILSLPGQVFMLGETLDTRTFPNYVVNAWKSINAIMSEEIDVASWNTYPFSNCETLIL